LYGDSETTIFDVFSPILIGFFIFFFVFLISGIGLLRERTTGTLEKLMATPIKRTKAYADSFYKTNLEEVLSENGIEELIICGMQTQNCVTHTAISKAAEKYSVKIIPDCCTTFNETIHLIALSALEIRLEFVSIEEGI